MFLSKLNIYGYRSFGSIELKFNKGKNIIIGKNNAGKSNIIKALDIIFNENKPDYPRTDNICDNDFFTYCDENGEIHKSVKITIATEISVEENDFNDIEFLDGCGYFKVFNNTDIKVDIPLQFSDFGFLSDLKEENLGFSNWVNVKQNWNNKISLREFLDGITNIWYIFNAYYDENQQMQKDLRMIYKKKGSNKWGVCLNPSIRTFLIQSAIMPSFRDPQNQLRLNQWSWYGKLMKKLIESHQDEVRLKSALTEVTRVANDIFSRVTQDISEKVCNIAFPGTEMILQFNTDKRDDLYKSTTVYIDDGFKSQLTEKGSGIQSATIIGLFNFYTKEINTKGSALLCIEEPEVYLHPHAQRVISKRLDDFLQYGKHQVIITTHSPTFIKGISSDTNIIRINKINNTYQNTSLTNKEFSKFIFNMDQHEFLWADKVILCEGFDEYIIKLISEHLYPGQLDSHNISIIQVDSKDKFSHYVALLLKLKIKVFIVADFDYLLRDKEDSIENIKKHESISSLNCDYFKQTEGSQDDRDKMVSKISRLRNRIKEENLHEFYNSKNIDSFNSPLKENIKEFLADLAKKGTLILSGEIENFIINKEYFVDNKVKYDTILKLYHDIEAGKNIHDLLIIDEFESFFDFIYNASSPS